MFRKLALPTMALAAALFAPRTAHASFHLWKIEEIFSNEDGSIQYVELSCASPGQGFLSGHTLTGATRDNTVTFTFPNDLAGDTTGRHIIVATPGFENLPGAVTPDYVLPCGPFFDPNADLIEIDFAGFSNVIFEGTELPTDGTNALYDLDHDGVDLTTETSSPTNFAGDDGSLDLGGCLADGSCGACEDGVFCNGVETCSGSACVAGTPCPGLCEEITQICIECGIDEDCDDGEECTTDACENDSTCSHAPVDDGTACTDDALFCNGAESCNAGACVGEGDPCDVGDVCDEDADTCSPGGAGGAGSGGSGSSSSSTGTGTGGNGEGAAGSSSSDSSSSATGTGGTGEGAGDAGSSSESSSDSSSSAGPGPGPGAVTGAGPTTASTTGVGGEGGGGDGANGEGSGCDCRAAGEGPSGQSIGLALALGGIALARRRRGARD